MKNKTTIGSTILVLVLLTCLAAAPTSTILYTSKPNATPAGSDFLAFQRNTDFISASINQFSNMLFSSTFFTGTVTLGGNLTVNGVISGNGAGLFGFPGSGVYVLNLNGNATNATLTGTTTFLGNGGVSFDTNGPPPVTPALLGDVFVWNSNGVIYQVNSKVNALAWTKTNLISTP